MAFLVVKTHEMPGGVVSADGLERGFAVQKTARNSIRLPRCADSELAAGLRWLVAVDVPHEFVARPAADGLPGCARS